MGESSEFLVGDFVEAPDMAAILAAQLREPYVCAFGDEDGAGHPGHVGREMLVFVRGIAEGGHIGTAGYRGPLLWSLPGSRQIELRPDRKLFFAENVGGHHQEALEHITENRFPELANHL